MELNTVREELLTYIAFQVFHAGPSKQMHWITTSGNGSIQESIRRGDDDDAMNGKAVMYDIGKILTLGGAKNYAEGAASKRAYIIDINGSEATVKRTRNDMQFPRTLVNGVVLPNGQVVVIGGMTSVKLFSDANAVLEAEIWTPSTESFKTLKRMRFPRTYHSVALIMKDGRVWAAGKQRIQTKNPLKSCLQEVDFAVVVMLTTRTLRY
jgi:galactose oxidase